jgi:protein-tyrosine-phosphatase
MNLSQKIAEKDFSKKVIDKLRKKGIEVVGVQAAPLDEKDVYFSDKVYKLSVNGNGMIRTHSQVIVMANSSWMPEA